MFLIQHAWGAGDKIEDAVSDGTADGVIWSPADLVSAGLRRAAESSELEDSIQALDPQLYVARMSAPNTNRKRLPRYAYFSLARRADGLAARLPQTIETVLDLQANLPLTEIIAPTVAVEATGSQEYGLAQRLAQLSLTDWSSRNDARDIFVSVACTSALLDNERETNAILNWLTTLECDGFYLLFEIDPGADERAQIDRLARALWMSYSLADNEYRVWIGYAGLGGYVFRVAGAEAFASGWWQKGRWWSLAHWLKRRGRAPENRVALAALLSIPSVSELEALRTADRQTYEDALEGPGDLARRLRSTSQGVPRVHRGRDDEAAQLFAVCDALDRRISGGFQGRAQRFLSDTATARSIHVRMARAGISFDARGNDTQLDIWDDALRRLALRLGINL